MKITTNYSLNHFLGKIAEQKDDKGMSCYWHSIHISYLIW